jgi:hypothetical protein
MKQGRTLTELAVELDRQRYAKKDYIIDTRRLTLDPTVDGGTTLTLGDPDHGVQIITSPNELMHRQIGTALKIPAPYYNMMMKEYPELLAENVNGWFRKNPTERMVRTLDGTSRAFLSNRYRRIDNYEIAETVLPIIQEIPDAIFESCEVTDTHMYLKVVNPRMTMEVAPGDVVQSGIIITNSEVGLSSVKIQPLVYRLVCTNGMVVNDAATRKNHVGRVNSGDSNYELFADDTLIADDKAFMLKIRDTVRATVDDVRFRRVVEKMRETKGVKITTTEIPKMVEMAGSDFGYTKKEGSGILDHLIRGGDFSLYGFANAVTRYSQDVESYDRATELESIGYTVMTMPKSTWKKLNQKAEDAA